jgi:hypothetical protein
MRGGPPKAGFLVLGSWFKTRNEERGTKNMELKIIIPIKPALCLHKQ